MSGVAARMTRGLRKRGVAGSARLAATVVFVIVLVAIAEPTPVSVGVGAALVALGEAWRIWSAGHLLKSLELAVSGPYRHVQNPLYFGRLCIFSGFALMARLPVEWGGRLVPAHLVFLAAVLLVFFAYYLPRKVRVEGERLQRRHGEAWETWAAAVPVVFPRVRPFGRNVRGWSAERFARNGELWMALAVCAVTLAFAWKAGLLGA
ncbi:MAG: methyltransferase family protein [Planctomycetota bacterium]|jgi:protein-S-isoprenylcysteine O-methyltransferase Ste14